MRTLLLLWPVLAGAAAWLRCPEGQPCPATPALSASSAAACRDGSPCPAGASCPLPEGVPCAGGRRCCPRGSRCSADGESCITPPAPRAIPCPDGQSECPDDATCCMTASGAWGCCPMPQASCCADKVHCCPHATICDLARGRCLSPAGDVPMGTPFPAWKRRPPTPVALRQVLCPDGRSACPDGSTCCPLPSAQYGCCPLQNAVCCGDGQHCCPQGTACDLEHSVCTSLGGWAQPLASLPKAREVKCDAMTSCPDRSTCCRLSSGAWGCCPLEEAVCCPDHVHCCPQGYTCDSQSSSCLEAGGSRRPWVQKTPALARGGDVRCDDTTSCPDGNTCCRTSLGTWGCCPLEQAVCCPDHVHCCPHGYTCDPQSSSCLEAGGSRRPWVQKTPALARGGDVRCDDTTSCPDGNTCCRTSQGTWGCCPLEQAVCCPDHVHCCPHGYTCDPQSSSCLEAGGSRRPWVQKTPALARGGDVRCDDTTSCPDGNTCCRTSQGTWGCCPLEQAVCCPDHVHCCPHGYTCDPQSSSCLEAGGSRRPWVQKTPALARGGDVRCDDTTSCPDGNTCCRTSQGTWACCPLEQAVCCPDHVHCCPHGYTCDPQSSSCLEAGGSRRPWVQKTPALARGGDVRCDDTTSCPDGNTCCRTGLGTWGCCPLEQAICCRDHQHCCPQGYTCNVATQSCEKLLASTALLPAPASPARAPAPPGRAPAPPGRAPAPLRAPSTHPDAAVPCDAAHSCRSGQQCCRSRGGSWGCCPFAQGSCCSNGRHCCPRGSRCTWGGWGCSPQRWDLPAPRRVLL